MLALRLASVPQLLIELPSAHPTQGWPPFTGSLPSGRTAV